MEYIMIAGLGALLVAAIIKIILNKRNLRALTKEFKMLITEEGNGELHVSSPSSDVEKFLEVFNLYMEKTKRNQRLVRKKEQALKEEIANISHDLRTPLTSMKGYVRLLKEDDIVVEERRNYLAVIERKTEQLQYLVEQLYEYTSLKGKSQDMQMERIELYGFFSNQILNYYHDFEKRGIQVSLSEEQQYDVLADRQVLERIFGNLIGNVLKYGREWFQIEFEHKDQGISVVLKNPAGNLNEEEIQHLFERFYMQEASRTKGSGLGLTIAKMLMESMGGEMMAELEEGYLKMTLEFLSI